MQNPESPSQFNELQMNVISRRNINKTIISTSLTEYDRLITSAYDTALLQSDEVSTDLNLTMIPESIREIRTFRLKNKVEEYSNRIIEYHTLYRPMYLAPEQALYKKYGERTRRGMLKMIIERGGINTDIYHQALQQVEGIVIKDEYINSIDVLKDYLVDGKTGYGSGLPQIHLPKISEIIFKNKPQNP